MAGILIETVFSAPCLARDRGPPGPPHAAAYRLAAATQTLPLALLAFSVAAIGVWGVMGPFWALATALLSGTAAAAGIALINALGNVGGFLGPYLMGWLKQTTASFSAGLAVVALILLAGCALVLMLRRPRQMAAPAADVHLPV